MAYFRKNVGIPDINEAIKKLQGKIPNLVEAGEPFYGNFILYKRLL
jgi:hypothetical protein